MALKSFSLRRPAPDRGSYVRYDAGVQNVAASAGDPGDWIVDDPYGTRDVDRYLRSDDYLIPPNEYVDSFISANSVEYGVVELNWQMPLESEIGETPVATESLLVYSPAGSPLTVQSGTVLQQSPNNFTYRHTDVAQGKWAYYGLFVRYQSSIFGDFYEKVADIEVLVPRNYQSTLELWRRIPQYYRELDVQHEDAVVVPPNSEYATRTLGALPGGYIVGPLFKFLSIFGFEMDRMRTIIDHVMVSKDPAESNTETLTALTAMMGLPYTADEISGERLRALLDDIGYIRRNKGTQLGAELYGSAFSGSEVDIDPVTKCLTFYAQRVNHILDPLNASGLASARPAHECEAQRPLYNRGTYDPTTYIEGDESTYPSKGGDTSYLPGMYWTSASATTFKNIPVEAGDKIVAYSKNGSVEFAVHGDAFLADNYDAYNIYSYSGPAEAIYTPNGSGDADGVTHLLFQIDCPVPVRSGDRVAFSVHSAVGTEALKWVRLITKERAVVGQSSGLTKAGDAPAAQARATDNLSEDDWTVVLIEFLIDLSAVDSYQLKYLLAERNHLGEYFDGSFTRGGWLTDPDGNRTSDYRWTDAGDNLSGFNDGTPFYSISVYSEDYRRTRSLLYNSFKRALPITVADAYEFCAFDAVPGMDAIDDYYDSFWKFRTASDTTATGGHAAVDGYVIWTADAPTVVGSSCTAHAIISGYDRGVYDTDNNYDYISYSESYSYSSTPYADPDTDYNAAPCT
jgi:hypothetical protein